MPQSIQITTPFILLLGLVAVAFLLTYWQYRSTVPAISNTQKIVLMFFRFITLFMLMLLIFKPSLDLRLKQNFIPKTQVYVDQSLSLAVVDSVSNPEYQMSALLQKLNTLDNVSFYTFNTAIKECSPQDTLYFNGLTNFERVFRHFNSHKFEQAVLLSDGYVTDGSYPKTIDSNKELKLFTVGLGNQNQETDIFIDEVDFEPVAYLDEKQIIRARIGSRHLSKKINLELQLKVQGIVSSNKKITLDTTDSFQSIIFEYTPHETGLTKLQVSIQKSSSDTEILNNVRSFTMTVLKKKLTVAIYTTQADYDGKFIYQILQSEPDIECNYYIERADGRFGPGLQPSQNSDPDILILQNYPGPRTPIRNLKHIERLISNRISSLLLFTTKLTRLDKLQSLADFIPISKMSTVREEFESADFSAEPLPLLDLFGSSQLNHAFWQNLPPIYLPKLGIQIKKEATIILHSGKRPVLLQFNKPGYRNLTFIGNGFWRWHFLLQDKPELFPGYRNLLMHSLRWLAGKESLKQVQLSSSSQQTNPGNPVRLKGFLYDAAFNPIRDGQMRIQVQDNQGQSHILAHGDSSGSFQAEYTPTREGRILFVAEGFRDQLSLGLDTVVVESLPLEKEFLNSGINEPYLKTIAKNHGGQYFQANQIDSLLQVLKSGHAVIVNKKQIDLWNLFYIMLIILVSVLAEWVLRKRFGLI